MERPADTGPDAAATDPAAPDQSDAAAMPRLLMITGMSGAGKSSALEALEDVGYEVVDNLPLTLLPHLVTPAALAHRPLAISIDARNRDFAGASLEERLTTLLSRTDLRVDLVFLECGEEELQRRYSRTRRRHPLAPDRPVLDGIRAERRMLAHLRDLADPVIDTTELNEHALRRLIGERFAPTDAPGMSVRVVSFAFGQGVPRQADLVFDVRFLRNPYYVDALKDLTGQDEEIARFVGEDPDFDDFIEHLKMLLQPLLPRYRTEGKSYLTIAVGCTGGRHRSVLTAELLSAWLAEAGYPATLQHRELQIEQPPDESASQT